MRIVGGRLKGKTLASPKSQSIRPTTDRVRETLFNILAHGYDHVVQDARVLDLFAGTGALGCEALSRGASSALFVEDGIEGRGLIRTNMEAFGLNGVAKIFRRDATKLGDAGTVEPFSLVFMDPPYNKSLGEQALASAVAGGWLLPQALIVWEENAKADLAIPDRFETLEVRPYGETKLTFLRFLG
ncbi:16S rRNA (guanine(966)-N(2))-methyltransferase RsmD [Cohaesibacter celericrescens]|uniref:16S rRNA (Guanine(966)-N(2))-methyltransferase RsmD n=1 Tax=Cohaesibacter celericrescens TaxID=2067669 RepID=A0A2N5XKA5_9HYPH|nr:16S rRNA (guanine(966)-N(2))-methyltransferase RsmD [Cohaesibacter celericrescens]PLW74946.1 16S rRNA (guanine(966)-N(2))-methyltransferase RsmD [Cohaesibacter celericrescens]